MKKQIYFITGNKSKYEEAQLILNNASIVLVQKDLQLTEIQSIDQEQIVLDKAEQAFNQLKQPVLVDDTAIFFEQYLGFPGVYTKHVFNTLGIKGIQRLLRNSDRSAYFRTLVCYKDAQSCKLFSGVWKGVITRNISKLFNPDWQYNSIFIPEGYTKPLSEISIEERSTQSHRRKAFNELMRYFA